MARDVVLHRLLFLVVPVGGRGENPFRLAIYLGHWWPGKPMREGVRIVGGRLWLPGNDRPLQGLSGGHLPAAAAPAVKMIQVRVREGTSPRATHFLPDATEHAPNGGRCH